MTYEITSYCRDAGRIPAFLVAPISLPVYNPAPKAARLAACARRIAARDEKALAELFDATVGRVFAVAFNILGDAAAADEVVSDVYFQFWREADRYDPARSSVQVWLLVICRSRALDARRRMREELHRRDIDQAGQKELADDSCDLPDLLAATEEGGILHTELASLTAWERQLLTLAFFRGCTHQEISEREHVPLGTVKSNIRGALLRLRRVLREQGLER